MQHRPAFISFLLVVMIWRQTLICILCCDTANTFLPGGRAKTPARRKKNLRRSPCNRQSSSSTPPSRDTARRGCHLWNDAPPTLRYARLCSIMPVTALGTFARNARPLTDAHTTGGLQPPEKAFNAQNTAEARFARHRGSKQNVDARGDGVWPIPAKTRAGI